MIFNSDFFEDEVQNGFYVPALMKRCRAAETEVLETISRLLEDDHIGWCADGDTLRGAVKYGGFLPWSDRVDIAVSCEDRQAFLKTMEKLPEDLKVTADKYQKNAWNPDTEESVYIINGDKLNRSGEFTGKYHGFPFGCGIHVHFRNNISVGKGSLLSFESMKIPVPDQPEQYVKENASTESELTSETDSSRYHDSGNEIYPCYMKQEMKYRSETNTFSPYFYEFRKGDLISNREHDGSTLADNFLSSFMDAHSQVLMAVQMSENEKIIRVFTKAQDTAVKFGNFIEVNFPEASIVVVPMLEAYCNRLYLLGEVLTATPADLNTTRAEYGEEAVTPEVYLDSCMKFASAVEAAVKSEIIGKKEVVFLPFKASGWKNMEPLYRYYKSRKDCRVYVVPVPYYHVTDQNTAGERVYEGADFPDEVDAVPYDGFNLYTHMPDTVITQNPYDQYSMGIRLPADLYSDELRKFTRHLIYVPWFEMNEIDRENPAAVAMSDYYIRQPGVVKADVVLVQSSQMRKFYIDRLTAFAGADTLPVWEKKIQTMEGSVVI